MKTEVVIQTRDNDVAAITCGYIWEPVAELVVSRRGRAYVYARLRGQAIIVDCRWDWSTRRLDQPWPDHPNVPAVVRAMADWACSPEGRAWLRPLKPARLLRPPARPETVRDFYRAAILRGWTPATYLLRTLRGRANMGRHLARLTQALEADEAAGRANRVRSVGGRWTWVPVCPDCEALEPVLGGRRLVGWELAFHRRMTPEEYLAAVGEERRDL